MAVKSTKDNLQIAVYNSECALNNKINKKILEHQQKYQWEVKKILWFIKEVDMIHMLTENFFDLIFLAVCRTHMEGFLVAEQVRLMHRGTEIIFISDDKEMVYKSLDYKPFAFILKAHLEEEIFEVLSKYIKKRVSESKRVNLPTTTGKSSILVERIYYIESFAHYLEVVSSDGKIKIRDNIGKWNKELEVDGFLRIHRSYLVNQRYIYGLCSDGIMLTTGEILPLARGRRAEVQRNLRKGE